MKVLFIGGYGNISWWCTKCAIEKGYDVYLLNRDLKSGTRREIPSGAKVIQCDLRDFENAKKILSEYKFDVVCDFICYNKQEADFIIDVFKNKIEQYIVISSGGNYDRNVAGCPLKEDAAQFSQWGYLKNKIEIEKIFMEEYKKSKFPITIVRPGQIYDTLFPDCAGNADFTNIKRLIEEKPIIVLGEGTTPWTLLHSSDFANAFVELIGNKSTIGEAYHIAGEEFLDWNRIVLTTAKILNKKPKIIHMTTDFIEKFDKELADSLRAHKIYWDIYDNSKIKSVATGWSPKIKFEEGAKMSLDWLLEDEKRQRVNEKLDKMTDLIIEKWNSV